MPRRVLDSCGALVAGEGERDSGRTADIDNRVASGRTVDPKGTDSVVLALAQLVRDRWEADRRAGQRCRRTINVAVTRHRD